MIQSEEIAFDNFCEVNRKNVNKQYYKFDETLPSTSTAHILSTPLSSDYDEEETSSTPPSVSTLSPRSFLSNKPKPTLNYLNNPDYEQPFDEYVLLSQSCYLEKRCRTKLFSKFEPTQPYIGYYLNVNFLLHCISF